MYESSKYVFSSELFREVETSSEVSIPFIREVRSFMVEAMSGTSSTSMLELVVWDGAEAEVFMMIQVVVVTVVNYVEDDGEVTDVRQALPGPLILEHTKVQRPSL